MQRPKSKAPLHRRWFPALVVIAGGCAPAPSKGCDSEANPIPSALHDCVHDHDDWIATQNVHRNVIVALSEAATAVSDMNRVAAHFRQALIYSKLPAASAEEAAALTWTFPVSASAQKADQLDGTYRVVEGAGATLDARVFDPDSGERIEYPVLSLDSYFEGAALETSVPASGIAADPEQTVSFTLTWTGRGALADRIDPERKLESPLSFESSFDALGEAGPIAGLEPFDALLDLEAEWSIGYDGETLPTWGLDLSYPREAVHVSFHAEGARLPLRQRAKNQREEDFAVSALEAKLRNATGHGTPALHYAGQAHLAGDLELAIKGRNLNVRVHDDYSGDDSEPPESASVWSCP